MDKAGFDEFCESRCRKFYHEKLGRPSLVPGMYFRLMLIGFFEGIDSERGIAWRVAVRPFCSACHDSDGKPIRMTAGATPGTHFCQVCSFNVVR